MYVDQKINHMHMINVTDMCPAKNICDTLDILKISSLELGAQKKAIL